MKSFLNPKVLSRLAGLPLEARFPMLGSVSGRHASPVRGSSLEFAEYREYVPGDDTRRLDWRAWGRSDRFYIKEFEADTNLRLCLIVDTSGSMNYGPNGTTDRERQKLMYAKQLSGTLAWLAAQQGDAVGLFLAGNGFDLEIQPKRGGAHLKLVLDEIGKATAGGETGLVDSLHQAAEKIGQRALVVIVSDLFVEPDELKSCFQHLRFRRHDVVVFHLLETGELDFDFDRPIRFADLEGGLPMLADPVLIKKQYREAVLQYMNELKQVVQDTQVDYHRVDLSENYAEVLAKFLTARR